MTSQKSLLIIDRIILIVWICFLVFLLGFSLAHLWM